MSLSGGGSVAHRHGRSGQEGGGIGGAAPEPGHGESCPERDGVWIRHPAGMPSAHGHHHAAAAFLGAQQRPPSW